MNKNDDTNDLSDIFSHSDETLIIDVDKSKISKSTTFEKSLFLKSLEKMSASDIVSIEKKEKKKRFTGDFFIRIAAFAICFGILGVSLYMITDRVIGDVKAQMRIDELKPVMLSSGITVLKKNLMLPNNDTLLSALARDDAKSDFEEFFTNDYEMEKQNLIDKQKINPDVFGWIRINQLQPIDYPIMISSDNDYYLYRNFYRAYETAGSIFADFRMSRNNMQNTNLIIYGHNMTSGSMFRAISEWYQKYTTRDAIAKEMNIEIITVDGVYIYKVFSAYIQDGVYFTKASFSDSQSVVSYYKDILSYSILPLRPKYTQNTKICTLVTCTNVTGRDADRYVLHGYLTEVRRFED